MITCSAFFSNFSSSLSVPRQSLLSFVVFSFCFSNATECLSSTALISEERASGRREISILLIELYCKFGAIQSKKKEINVKECLTSRRGVSVADATFSQSLVLLLDLHDLLALEKFFLNLVKNNLHHKI